MGLGCHIMTTGVPCQVGGVPNFPPPSRDKNLWYAIYGDPHHTETGLKIFVIVIPTLQSNLRLL